MAAPAGIADPPASQEVSLPEMLAARDRRAARQRDLIARHRTPVVSLTAVMPGPVKDTPLTRRLVAAGVEAVLATLAGRGWAVLERLDAAGPTGAETQLAVAAAPRPLKQALLALEESHPLGRLWDIDVLADEGEGLRVLSRREFGLPPRACLVCGGPAHACARSRAHPVAELVAIIEKTAHASLRAP